MSAEEPMDGTMGSIKSWYIEKYASNKTLTVFVTGLVAVFLLNVIVSLFTEGSAFAYMVHPRQEYVFMDHFGSVIFSSDHPYTQYEVVYPPLITLIYAVIGHFTIPYMDGYEIGWDMACAMRSTSMPMMVFMTLIMALIISFYIIYQKYTEDNFTRQEFNILFICLLFSYPVLFGISTGNCIFLALLCTILYIYCYDSDDKRIRILSYVFLGVAAGVKIIPAIFGILTLKRRGWLEFFECVIIVTAMLLVPFVFTDGDPITFIKHTLEYGSYVPSTFGILNISDLTNALGISGSVSVIIKILFLGVVLCCILLDDKMERWEEATILGSVVMLTFSISVPYTLSYMMIGLIMLLTLRKELTRGMMLVILCFIVIFADIPAFTELPTYIGTMKGLFLAILTIYLLAVSIMRLVKSSPEEKKPVSIRPKRKSARS